MKKTILAILISMSLISCGGSGGSSGGGGSSSGTTSSDDTASSNELPSSIDFQGNSNIVLKSVSGASSSSFSADGANFSTVSTVNQLGAMDSGSYQALIDDPNIDIKKVENYSTDSTAYISFDKEEGQTSDSSKSVLGSITKTYHAFKDSSNALHYLSKEPTSDPRKTNARMIQQISTDTISYLNDGNVIQKNLNTDVETVLNREIEGITESFERYDVKETTNGKAIITYGDKVKIWNNGEPTEITELEGKNGLLMGDYILHNKVISATTLSMSKVGDDGVVANAIRSNQIAYQNYLDTIAPGSVEPKGAMNVNLTGEVKGEFYFTSTKVYIAPTDTQDLEEFSLVGYGHNSVDSLSNTRKCYQDGDLFYYSQTYTQDPETGKFDNEFVSAQFTVTNRSKDTWKYLDQTHRFTSVQCIGGRKVVAKGENVDTGTVETVTFTIDEDWNFTKEVSTESVTPAESK